MKTIEEFESLFDEHRNVASVSRACDVTRKTLYDWIDKSGFDLKNWKSQNMGRKRRVKRKVGSLDTPLTQRKIIPDIILTIQKEDGLLILKNHIEDIMNRQVEVYGESSSSFKSFHKRIWGNKVRDRKTVDEALKYFITAMQEIALKRTKIK